MGRDTNLASTLDTMNLTMLLNIDGLLKTLIGVTHDFVCALIGKLKRAKPIIA